MGDAIVGATVQVLFGNVLSLASDSIGSVYEFKTELETLRESAAMIQAVLADFEYKQMHSRAVQLWLKRLQGVAFDAEHVLDELRYETLRRKVKSQNQQLNGKVCFFFSFSNVNNIRFRWRMASKVGDINMKLKKINQEAHDFGLIGLQIAAPIPPINKVTISRQTDSIVGCQNVVGRANDESRIVEMLLCSSEKAVSVIPIVGMAGIGKTTLAKLVYNNPQIDGHFGKKIWVCVSENFQEMELFKKILETLTGRNVTLSSKDVVLQEIRKEMEGKRYFLVLDDVWNENQKLWDDFFDSLSGLITTSGSRCLVTTRLEQVASIVSRHPPYLLDRLSDGDCWSILKEKAISDGEVPEELNVMRKQILKRCNGLPLAASVLGGLLRIKRKEEWLSIVENRLLNLREDNNSVEQIIKLSFDNLPSALIKKCFGYCSIFAKDAEIERDLLIELWMAEGFLQLFSNQSVMEDIGDQYIKVLLDSSLLEEVRDSWKTRYKMHDLVHDLAESISNHESIKLENGAIENYDQVRYLAFTTSDETTGKILGDMSTSVRTLFVHRGICYDMLSKFRNLHVLNIRGANFKKLPTSIGKLIHLRFLDLSSSEIETLPESLCKLYNLQTLRIYGFQYKDGFPIQIGLPKQMSNLISLRHLHYFNPDENFQMPVEMGRLTYLQTLEFFNIGQEKGRQIEELRCLKDLKGKLVIRNLHLVNGKQEAERANLPGKPNLLKLEFLWGKRNGKGDNCDEDVLEGLRPHPDLRELYMSDFMGDLFPQWFMNLSRLVDLSLIDCSRSKELPAGLGQLPFLQNLEFSGLENVRCIGLSFYGVDDDFRGGPLPVLSRKLFRALKALTLRNMGNLVEWMEPEVRRSTTKTGEAEADVFPMLEIVTIEDCSQLATAPSHFPSLEKLEIIRNDNVVVVKKILSKVNNLSSLMIIGKTGVVGLTCLLDVAPGLRNNHQKLKYLSLRKCPDLTHLQGCGTSLKSLELIHCDNLRELPDDLCGFQSLCNLEIVGCPRINLIPNHGQQSLLTSLEHLKISDCYGLVNVPGEMLESCKSLKWLCVYECPNLVSFPILESFQQVPSLIGVSFHKCPKLMSVPKGFGFLTSLSQVRIGPFSDEKSSIKNEFDWSGLMFSSTLRKLELYGLPHNKYLPDQLQYLTTLTALYLYDFGIEVLPDWIGNLESLQSLHLLNCEKLRYLPSMAAMRRLSKLNYLHINGSPLLKERCSPQSSLDSEWSKISHVPLQNIW